MIPARLLIHFTKVLVLAASLAAAAQPLSGRWDGTAHIHAPNLKNGFDVPVHLDLTGSGDRVRGELINGTQHFVSTSGEISGNSLHLAFAQYAVTLRATWTDGVLRGTYSKDDGTFSDPFELKPHQAHSQSVSAAKAPNIAGVWTIPIESPKGEHAWRLVVHQAGPEVSATILRVDGDTGTLAGSFRDGKFVLSHFADVRPALLEITPASDGTLKLLLYGTHINAGENVAIAKLQAIRPVSASLKSLPAPDDPGEHTSVRNPDEPFRFSFPDLSGKLVSNTDSQFKGKVVLVNVTGSWCPNCHDEAPYLESLYRQYHARGLEIVALDFEEPAESHSLTRLHSFLKRYGIQYTYLLAGQPGEVNAKIPQAVHLNAWPTSFFIGRDGRVHAVETGFPSPGSPEFERSAHQKYESILQRLLVQPAGGAAKKTAGP